MDFGYANEDGGGDDDEDGSGGGNGDDDIRLVLGAISTGSLSLLYFDFTATKNKTVGCQQPWSRMTPAYSAAVFR